MLTNIKYSDTHTCVMKSFVVCFSSCPDCVTHFFIDKNESLGLNIQYVLFVFYFYIILELHTNDKPTGDLADMRVSFLEA